MIARSLTGRLSLLVAVIAALVLGAFAPAARADGDPGSDVLVYQNLFVAADAGVSMQQQAQLGDLLRSAGRSGFPIRVAIVAKSDDLGAVTALWRQPAAYARFLGIELSLAYKQRLLVVMPNGFGFNWPGHSTAPAYRLLAGIPIGASGTCPGGQGNCLADAAGSAVRRLAQASGVTLGPPASAKAGPGAAAGGAVVPSSAPAARAGPAGFRGPLALAVALAALAAGAAAAWLGLRARRRRRPGSAGVRASGPEPVRAGWRMPLPRLGPRAARATALLLFTGIAGVGVSALILALGSPGAPSSEAPAANPNLDPGTTLSRPAPDFSLTDQFGQPVSLRQFRGKVVILAFGDSQCTTVCPLTTSAMLDAKAMLGAAGSQVQLLGVDANPKATGIEDVLSYSQVHGMAHQWHFLTGSLPQLQRVWRAYGIAAQVQGGMISHTSALYVIDPQGRERKLYMTQQSYAAVGQLGQTLAREASALLPGRPAVRSALSSAEISGIAPSTGVTLPRVGGGTVHLGPGSPRLLLFFATWDREITSLAGQLDALSQYQASAPGTGLPLLTAVDEGSVEPSRTALAGFLRQLPRPLSYPVAVDQTGRLADGYEVAGQPWFVLVSRAGRILWHWEVATSGWPSRTALIQHVRDALARDSAAMGAVAPTAPVTPKERST